MNLVDAIVLAALALFAMIGIAISTGQWLILISLVGTIIGMVGSYCSRTSNSHIVCDKWMPTGGRYGTWNECVKFHREEGK